MTEDIEQKTEGRFATIKGCKDLKVYQLAYKLSMEIFKITKNFPKEETYCSGRSDKTFIKVYCN